MAGFGMNVFKRTNVPFSLSRLININFHFILLHAYMFRVYVLFDNVYTFFVNLLKRPPRKISSANWVTLSK